MDSLQVRHVEPPYQGRRVEFNEPGRRRIRFGRRQVAGDRGCRECYEGHQSPDTCIGPNSRAFSARISAAICWVVRSPATYRSKTALAASVGSSPSSRPDANARATRAWRWVRSWSVIGLMIPAMNPCPLNILLWRRLQRLSVVQAGVGAKIGNDLIAGWESCKRLRGYGCICRRRAVRGIWWTW